MQRTVVEAPSDQVAPPVTVGPLTEERLSVLLWVHTGTATVEAAGATYRLSAGQAAWIPPGIAHATRTDEGALVFPIFPRAGDLPRALAQVQVIEIPPGWEDWMMHQYIGMSNVREPEPAFDHVLELVAGAPAPAGRTLMTGGALPMPHSPEARNVGRSLLREPGSTLPVELLAERENTSAKTLRRQFARETGMTIAQWRTRARLLAAAQHLIEGRSIGWTRREVGYVTAAGFTKSFCALFGLTPRDYAQRHAKDGIEMWAGSPVDEMVERAGTLIADPSAPPPPIPAREIWDQVNDCHVILYIHRGEITLRLSTRTCPLRQGDAMWVPAGVTHSVAFAEGAILMSFGVRYGRVNIDVADLKVYSFSPRSETYCLRTRLAETTLFRPENYCNPLIDDLFRDQFVTGIQNQDTAGLTGAVGEIARALRHDPADSRSLADWAARLHTTPHQLGQAFARQTGTTFPRWRSQVRMNVARDLLLIGDPPGEVARRLGYASVESFTNTFTATHSMPPRGYQRRQVR